MTTSISFLVTVNSVTTAPSPQLSSAPGAININFPAVGGKTCVIEYKNALAETNWATLATIAGTNGVISVSDSTLPQSSRF